MFNLWLQPIVLMLVAFLEKYQLFKDKVIAFVDKLQQMTLSELLDVITAVLVAVIVLYIAFELLAYLVKISSALFKLLFKAVIILLILAGIGLFVVNNKRNCFFDFEQYVTRCQMPDSEEMSDDNKLDEELDELSEEKTP